MGTAMTFQPRFGKYLLLKRIAKGGMAEIFRALAFGAEGFCRVVAIKRMLPHLSADPEFVDMFITEAKLTAQLSHANIVHMYDFGIIDDMLYHCMEYVQGTTLADIIQALKARGWPAPIPASCTLFTEALYGLDHAHRLKDRSGAAQNLIHRDITPSNLLVSWDGQVKIVDFGIARATHLRHHTVGNLVKGKLRYLSPEQATGKLLDQRTDIYSLGICMYELLTLSPLVPDLTEQQMLESISQAQITPARQRNPAIPEELDALVHKALAATPQQRFESAAHMRDALEEFQFQSRVRASPAALARLMQDLFRGRIEAESQQIAKETAVDGGGPSLADAQVAQSRALKTMIVKADQLPANWELYPDGEQDDPEDTADLAEPAPAPPAALPLEQFDTQEEPGQQDEPLIWADDAPDGSHPTPLSMPQVRTVFDAKSFPAPEAPRPGRQNRTDAAEQPEESERQRRPTPPATPVIQEFDDPTTRDPGPNRPRPLHRRITEKEIPRFTGVAAPPARDRTPDQDPEPDGSGSG
jgi:serine/threonine-protein kinase